MKQECLYSGSGRPVVEKLSLKHPNYRSGQGLYAGSKVQPVVDIHEPYRVATPPTAGTLMNTGDNGTGGTSFSPEAFIRKENNRQPRGPPQ